MARLQKAMTNEKPACHGWWLRDGKYKPPSIRMRPKRARTARKTHSFTAYDQERAVLKGERGLAVAVLLDAYDCLKKYANSRKKRERLLYEQALAWFLSDGATQNAWPFSFRNICLMLRLNWHYVRQGVLQWKERTEAPLFAPPASSQPVNPAIDVFIPPGFHPVRIDTERQEVVAGLSQRLRAEMETNGLRSIHPDEASRVLGVSDYGLVIVVLSRLEQEGFLVCSPTEGTLRLRVCYPPAVQINLSMVA